MLITFWYYTRLLLFLCSLQKFSLLSKTHISENLSQDLFKSIFCKSGQKIFTPKDLKDTSNNLILQTIWYFKQSDTSNNSKLIFKAYVPEYLLWKTWMFLQFKSSHCQGPMTRGLDPLELLNTEEVGDAVHRHRVHQVVANQLSDGLGRFKLGWNSYLEEFEI